GAYVIYPLIWEHKALKASSYREIEREGLEKKHANYLAQVALYQAYLEITNPALFTVTNADTCERLHFFIPFDAERAQFWSDRAVNIIEATRAGELLPRGFDDPDTWPCKQCSHVKRCWGQPRLFPATRLNSLSASISTLPVSTAATRLSLGITT